MLADGRKIRSQYSPIAFRCGRTWEGIRAREHLVSHDCQRPQIPRRIDFMAAQLFGGHVAHCSDGLPRVRVNRFLWTGGQELRKPEVHDFRNLAGVASY